jgi:DNA-binding transcriptional LysR family regulator
MPDIDALRALDAIVTNGGFAGAARQLNRVQSAISYQVRKLEDQLGLQLLDRDGYRVRLTPAGEVMLIEARKVLARVDHMDALARQFVTGWEPRLTLVVDGILPLEATLAALKHLAEERVPTRVQVKVEFLGGVQFRFEKDQADMMLVKDYQARPDLIAQSLPDVGCVLCASVDHPLAQAGSLSLADLQDHVELSVQDSSDQGNDRHMFGAERVFYLSGFEAKRQAILMGLGFGWMPDYLVEEDFRSGRLLELPFVGGGRYRFTPQLVRRAGSPLGRAGTRLADLLTGSG